MTNRLPRRARFLTTTECYFFRAVCLVCLAAGLFAVVFDFDRDDAFADDLEVGDFGRDLAALLPFELPAFELLALPMRPALTVVWMRPRLARATRSGRFQPIARSARNFDGISSIPSP